MSNFTLPLDIPSLEIVSQTVNTKGNIVFTVRSTCTKTTCHKCGKDAKKPCGHSAVIEYKHTSILDTPVILRIKPVRYECEDCDDRTTTTEKYDWVADGGKITKGLEEYLLRCVVNSTIQDVARKGKEPEPDDPLIIYILYNSKLYRFPYLITLADNMDDSWQTSSIQKQPI